MVDEILDRVDEVGFAVVRLFDPEHVAKLRLLVSDQDLDPAHGFFASVAHAWGPAARSFDLAARQVASVPLERILPGFRPFLASITSKGERSTTHLPYHQDWTYCDDRRHRTCFVWAPLVDTSAVNGTLRLIPGSHRWCEGIRPSRAVEVTEHLQAEFDALAEPVEMAAGEGLVFHPGAIHGSGPNQTDAQRPAITFALVSDGAPLVHFHEEPDGGLSGHLVDDAFFTEHPYRQRPVGYPAVEPWAGVTTAACFEHAIEARRSPSEVAAW